MADKTSKIRWEFEGSADDLIAANRAVEKALKKVGKAADKTEDEFDGLNKSSGATVTKFEGAAAAGRVYGGRLGELGEKLVSAQTAVAGLGTGMAAAVVGTAAAVAGTALLVVGFQALVVWADGAAEEMVDLGLVSEQQAASLSTAADSVTALTRQFKVFAIQLATLVAPIVEKFNLGLFAVAETISSVLAGDGIPAIEELAAKWAILNTEVKETGPAAADAAAATFTLAQALTGVTAVLKRRASVDAGFNKLGKDALGQLEEEIRLTMELAKIEIDTAQKRIQLAEQEGKTKEEIRLLTEDLALIQSEALLKEEIQREKLSDLQKTATQKEKDDKIAAFEATFTAGAGFALALGALAEQLAGENIALQKGVGIASVLIESAIGVVAAWKEPWPIAIAKIAAIGIAAGTSIAKITSVTADGGGGGAPSGGVSANSGQSASPGIDRGNGGPDFGSGGTFIMLDHRVFDAQTRDAFRRDSLLDRRLRNQGGGSSAQNSNTPRPI